MNRYLEKADMPSFDKDFTLLKVIDDRELNTAERLQLLEQVGNFSITPASLLKRIMKAQNMSSTKKNSSQENNCNKQIPDYQRKEIVI